jgi:hypothetical protein
MTHRIRRAIAGAVLSCALIGGAAVGTAVVTATPASAVPFFFFFHSPCAPHGHESIFCEDEI